MTIFREEATSALAGFHAGPLSWSNWNLECEFLWREGKTENPEKNPRSKDENQQQTQPTYDIGPELNPGPLSWSNWNLECWFLWKGEKTIRARTRTNNKLNPDTLYNTVPELNIGPWPHWWEASALTTAPSLLPCSPGSLWLQCLLLLYSSLYMTICVMLWYFICFVPAK